MTKKYLVTGGTGFIGRNFVERLVREGNIVKVFDNDFRGDAATLKTIKGHVEFIKGDIRDCAAVFKASKKIDSIVHLAFINGTENFYKKPDLVLEVGVKGIVNVIDAAINNNVKELILASSSEVYQNPKVVPTDETASLIIPDPLNPRYSYAAGKIISEMMAIHYGKYFERMLIFRPHNVYGPNMGWEHVIPQFVLRMRQLINKSPKGVIRFPIQGSGKETRAFVYIDDFVDGMMILKNKGKHLNIYHIGTEEEISISKVALELGEYFNRTIKIVPGELTKGSTPRRCPSILKMKKIGYWPKYSFAQGLPLIAKWYDENYHKAPGGSH